jgi:hypothetical protein
MATDGPSVIAQLLVRLAEDAPGGGLVLAVAELLRDSERPPPVPERLPVPPHTGTGLAAQAVALFLRYLFHTFPLTKAYLEVPGYNWAQVRSGEGTLFEVEGVLRDHHFYAGRRWDQYLCAIYRDRLPRNIA